MRTAFLVFFAAGFSGLSASAQPKPDYDYRSDSVERILTHVEKLKSLNARSERQKETATDIVKRREDAFKRLMASQNDLVQIQSSAVSQSLKLAQAKLTESDAFSTALSLFTSDSRLQVRLQGVAEYTKIGQSAVVEQINLSEQIKQLNLAEQLTVERFQKILNNLEGIGKQTQEWFNDELNIYHEYINVSDVANVQSSFQLLAALRELKKANKDNLGAQVATGITLLRLEQFNEADQVLQDLTKSDSIAQPLAKMLLAESLIRNGKEIEAQKLMAESGLYSQREPRLIWILAQIRMLQKDYKRAAVAWSKFERIGANDVAAHRGQAFNDIARSLASPENRNYAKSALEHARLADTLAGESEWSCKIALALATAINGDLPMAASVAEDAAKLAIVERRSQCLDMAAELSEGKIPSWK